MTIVNSEVFWINKVRYILHRLSESEKYEQFYRYLIHLSEIKQDPNVFQDFVFDVLCEYGRYKYGSIFEPEIDHISCLIDAEYGNLVKDILSSYILCINDAITIKLCFDLLRKFQDTESARNLISQFDPESENPVVIIEIESV